MSFLLELGPERFRAELTEARLASVLDDGYGRFLRPDSGSPRSHSELRLFVPEDEVEGWREADEVLGTGTWRLRRGRGRSFVVGTVYDPPVPHWVAAADPGFTRFAVAHLGPRPIGSGEEVLGAVLRVLPRLALMHHLLEPPTGMLVHAAAAAFADRMVLFPGHSGAGKSTISRLLMTHGAGEVVNDDRMLLTSDDEGWTAWGTPWPGELGIAVDRHAPLAALVFLEKSESTRIEALAPRDALARLVPVVSIPWYDPTLVPRSLDLLERLVQQVPAHVLHFRPDAGAVAAVLELAAR